jgi:hypothetical protein
MPRSSDFSEVLVVARCGKAREIAQNLIVRLRKMMPTFCDAAEKL